MGNCCSCDALGLGFFQKEDQPTPTPAFHPPQKKGSRPSGRPEAPAVYTTVSPDNIRSMMEDEANKEQEAQRDRVHSRGYQEEADSSARDRSEKSDVVSGNGRLRSSSVRQRPGSAFPGLIKKPANDTKTPLPLEKTLGEALLEKEREASGALQYGGEQTAAPGEAILEDSAWGHGKPLKASDHSVRRPLGMGVGTD
eukprot:CAMPEP_0179426158 /NCGR_PEP_ID=MMETSP0799-20121207/12579_1 /TAXON_ID=46947 /ORGANISM="Geminigera cryophila, Strain CCMP2564" /LENGTH=196 /DNA_ID=CAMNT_0021200871 /DNA_START=257 /DNA_END=845 /DNA_ORIENTATION=-